MSFAPLNSQYIKAQAQSLGFVACGLAPAQPVQRQAAQHYLRRIALRHYASMDYMYRHVGMRLHPHLLVHGVATIVSLALNYMPHRQQPAISLYAQGQDYHTVMRTRLCQLLEAIHGHGRPFVDTAPVMERYWAWRSGVGTFCRNGLISVPGHGPTVFLGELFLLESADHYDVPLTPYPAAMTGWPSLCPALTPEGLDAHQCLSYQTIEHRGPLPHELRLRRTFYGCDKCLRACPEFRQSHPTDDPLFQPSSALLGMSATDWASLTVEEYRQLFKGSAVKRAKYEGLMRNISHWSADE